jgi:hypothetical protein
VKEIKKKIVSERSSSIALDEGGVARKANNNHGMIPMPPPYEGNMSNASMGEWGSHATTSPTIHVPHKVFMAFNLTNTRRRNRKHCLSNWLPSPLG